MARPGKNDCHQMPLLIRFAPADRSRPQSGTSPSSPRPKNERPAAVRIASAALREKITGMAMITFAAMYRKMIRRGFAPIARAAST